MNVAGQVREKGQMFSQVGFFYVPSSLQVKFKVRKQTNKKLLNSFVSLIKMIALVQLATE